MKKSDLRKIIKEEVMRFNKSKSHRKSSIKEIKFNIDDSKVLDWKLVNRVRHRGVMGNMYTIDPTKFKNSNEDSGLDLTSSVTVSIGGVSPETMRKEDIAKLPKKLTDNADYYLDGTKTFIVGFVVGGSDVQGEKTKGLKTLSLILKTILNIVVKFIEENDAEVIIMGPREKFGSNTKFKLYGDFIKSVFESKKYGKWDVKATKIPIINNDGFIITKSK